MMPLGDDNSQIKSTPIVNYTLIALNILFFFIEMQGGEAFITKWAYIPSRFLAHPAAEWSTLFTSMFMHAGFAHIFGNMLYLYIFGDNVEDRMGRLPYLIFYLVCGLGATFSQTFFDTASSIPNAGASGAIAGVLGAYIFMYPQGKVNVLVNQRVTQMPALFVIGVWFALQFASGVSSLYSAHGSEGGVAYMAHVGGFLSGLAISIILSPFFRQDKQ
ncbi:MAG: rhomboid family intramembrane serine protease [Verrucomicrobia bacterium]|nr:rhomboid family intramembrane serine protease [Verrucomicrobiota bacterium]